MMRLPSFCRPRLAAVRLASVLVLAVLLAPGCPSSRVADTSADVKVDLAFRPDPPKVGQVAATVKVADRDGKPLAGAAVKLEGNMNHAGMTPVFADAKETEPGRYVAVLELTMGGDWFFLVNAQLADGRKLTRKIDVPRVKSR